MSRVQIDQITKCFGAFTAVDGISLVIPSGCVYGLLGPNGAGKTTTIRMIMNIFFPDSGEIRIDGQKLSERVKATIGYLPEERGLYKKMKVGEQLQYLARLKGLTAGEARRRATQWLERLDLGPWARKKVEDLSKGMQQKVQFAAALIHRPSLVILDEPFSGLDPMNIQLMIDWIAEIKAEGVTIIFSTHQMETIERLCESIALIHRGKVLIEGRLREIKSRFGQSKVRLELEDPGGFEPRAEGVLGAELKGGAWEIQLVDGDDGQALLAEAARHGGVVKFERMEPSLQELFVRMVNEARHEDGETAAHG